jgi:polyhydroxybutyrate depolymerase
MRDLSASRPQPVVERPRLWLWGAAALLGALACSTNSRSVTRREPSELEARAAGACGIASPAPTGRSEQAIDSGGLSRRSLLYVPRSAGSAARPLVFSLHGSGGSPEDQLELSGLEALAEEHGFVLLAPEGVDHRWNVPVDPAKPDDVRFIADAIERAGALACIDRQRVYATGFSGGGRMVSQLACDLSDRIAAIAAVGGLRFPGPCSAARPFPIVAFHGTADAVNPYDGGGQPYWGTGVEPALLGWAQHNSCDARSDAPFSPAVLEISYGGASCGNEVVLYRIDGFGHSWPGSLGTAPAAGSAAPSDVTANQVLWSFFERHPLAH